MSATADHYAARLDAHLPTLADDAARRAFLNKQFAAFEQGFNSLQIRCARDEATDVKGGEAFTYVECMCEITKRLAQYPEAAHAA